MTNRELLTRVEHRPWRLPKGNWSYYQEWNHTIFLHWAVQKSELAPFIPQELEIDMIDDKAWVSLVAFTMENIRPRMLPSFSPISDFDEVNIRTYVKAGGKSGVYFLSIEAGKRISAYIAKNLSGLPYRYSEISRSAISYNALNNHFGDQLSIDFVIGLQQQNKSALDNWLTERYALFQEEGTTVNKFEIHHEEWAINEIAISKLSVNYPRFQNLLNEKPNLAHYSDGVKVLAWDKEKLVRP